MSRVFKVFVISFFWLALFVAVKSPILLAQMGALEGDVIGFDGNPIVGALVSIDRKDIKAHYEVKTNKKGHYFHAGLPTALYRVSVQHDGKELFFFDNIKVPLGETLKLDFNLKEEAERAQAQPRELTKEEKEARAKAEAEAKKHNNMKAIFDQGRDYFAANQYDQAIESFTRAGELDPTQHVIFANLAESYKNLRKYDEAIENYNKALSIVTQAEKPNVPLQASYQMNLGIIFGLAGKTDEAAEAMKKSATLNPSTASKGYYNLGAVLVNSGKSAEAVEAFRQAVVEDPQNADAQYQLGISLVGMATVTPEGQTIPAPGTIEAFQKYLEIAPDGRFAASAKDMVATLSQSVQTEYKAEKGSKKK